MKKMVVLAVAAVVLALGVLVGVTGVAYLPVSLALGPCLRDWTSPSSYGTRASPLASTTFRVGSGVVRVCYGRPAARGRMVFGGIVPLGRLWRTGANEPTRLYTNTDLMIADIHVPRGRYALYTVPGPERWEIRLSSSILHWGNDISPAVQSQEIGHAEVPSDSSNSYVETFTIRTAPAPAPGPDDEVHLILEWESTRVVIPIRQVPASGQ